MSTILLFNEEQIDFDQELKDIQALALRAEEAYLSDISTEYRISGLKLEGEGIKETLKDSGKWIIEMIKRFLAMIKKYGKRMYNKMFVEEYDRKIKAFMKEEITDDVLNDKDVANVMTNFKSSRKYANFATFKDHPLGLQFETFQQKLDEDLFDALVEAFNKFPTQVRESMFNKLVSILKPQLESLVLIRRFVDAVTATPYGDHGYTLEGENIIKGIKIALEDIKKFQKVVDEKDKEKLILINKISNTVGIRKIAIEIMNNPTALSISEKVNGFKGLAKTLESINDSGVINLDGVYRGFLHEYKQKFGNDIVEELMRQEDNSFKTLKELDELKDDIASIIEMLNEKTDGLDKTFSNDPELEEIKEVLFVPTETMIILYGLLGRPMMIPAYIGYFIMQVIFKFEDWDNKN